MHDFIRVGVYVFNSTFAVLRDYFVTTSLEMELECSFLAAEKDRFLFNGERVVELASIVAQTTCLARHEIAND